MIPLTDESYLKQKVFHICKKEFIFNIDNSSEDVFIEYRRFRDLCHYTGKYRGAAHNMCNLGYKTLKEIPVVFHNGSVYFIILLLKN